MRTLIMYTLVIIFDKNACPTLNQVHEMIDNCPARQTRVMENEFLCSRNTRDLLILLLSYVRTIAVSVFDNE